MNGDPRAAASIVVGSLVVAIGSTVAGINAFEDRVGWVLVGFALFVVGYGLSQAGVHGAPALDVRVWNDPSWLALRGVLLGVGIAGIAVGVTLFCRTILQPSARNAALSGIASIGGYMVAHVGINGAGLGWTFFRRVRASLRRARGGTPRMTRLGPRRWLGFIAGMALTSASLSTGFIWACGSACVGTAVLWTPDRRIALVFGAALTAWWGYLIAHRAATGAMIDSSNHDVDAGDDLPGDVGRSLTRGPLAHHAGVLAGVGILVLGMVVGVTYIRQGNHLLTNLGGALFLGGYAIAHYVETGNPL